MKDLLIHLSRIIYKLQDVSMADKQELARIVTELSKKEKRFVPPTLSEVSEYLKEQGFQHPQRYADQFVSFYESKGWMIGKNKMKNWRMATKQWKEWEKKTKVLV
jgi:hypothetical protein